MSPILPILRSSPEFLTIATHFDCSDKPYKTELRDWLFNSAVECQLKGTKVWFYVNQTGGLVGYESLRSTNWEYVDGSPQKKRILILPALAIAKPFHGKSDDVGKEPRYSSQIMPHLCTETIAEFHQL
jgi:hypothetical protein